MRRSGILLFLISLYLILIGLWLVFPAGGVHVGPVILKFPSCEQYLADLETRAKSKNVNVDGILAHMQKRSLLLEEGEDALESYFEMLEGDPARVRFPNDDFTYFDSLFCRMGRAREEGKVVRVLHYGDSQLEEDRISSSLRQRLQERFGGCGPGMVPFSSSKHAASISQFPSGNYTRFANFSDAEARTDFKRRYGPLAEYSSIAGSASVSFRPVEYSSCQPLVKRFNRVSVLMSQDSTGLMASLRTVPEGDAVMTLMEESGLSLASWELPDSSGKGSLAFSGSGEVYGVLFDGESGVAVDNVPVRGSNGTMFSRQDSIHMKSCFDLIDPGMIILQYGCNAMPGIASRKGISNYMSQIKLQLDYFKKVAPDAALLFVGPADMEKSVNGAMVTWPLLPEMVDSLRNTCLSNGVAFWDTYSMMGGYGSLRKWVQHNPPLAGPDYIHFTSRGAREVGDVLSGTLMILDDFYHFRQEYGNDVVRESFYARMNGQRVSPYKWRYRESVQ